MKHLDLRSTYFYLLHQVLSSCNMYIRQQDLEQSKHFKPQFSFFEEA